MKTAMLDDILTAVCEQYKVSGAEVKSRDRTNRIQMPRLAFCYIAAKFEEYSSCEVGVFLGDRNHSTIVAARKEAQRLFDTDKLFKEKINTVLDLFKIDKITTLNYNSTQCKYCGKTHPLVAELGVCGECANKMW